MPKVGALSNNGLAVPFWIKSILSITDDLVAARWRDVIGAVLPNNLLILSSGGIGGFNAASSTRPSTTVSVFLTQLGELAPWCSRQRPLGITDGLLELAAGLATIESKGVSLASRLISASSSTRAQSSAANSAAGF